MKPTIKDINEGLLSSISHIICQTKYASEETEKIKSDGIQSEKYHIKTHMYDVIESFVNITSKILQDEIRETDNKSKSYNDGIIMALSVISNQFSEYFMTIKNM